MFLINGRRTCFNIYLYFKAFSFITYCKIKTPDKSDKLGKVAGPDCLSVGKIHLISNFRLILALNPTCFVKGVILARMWRVSDISDIRWPS